MTPLAAQLYSLRTTDRDIALRDLSRIGYQAVEPYDPLTDPAGFRAAADAAGLSVCSVHAPVLGPDREALPAALRTLGTDRVVVPWIPPEGFAADRLDDTARRLDEAAAWAAGLGLRLGYHNHHWELASTVDGRTALEALAERVRPEVFFEVDVYWAAVGGADVPALLGRLGPRVEFLHVKDGPATVDEPMTAVGAGTLPIPEILAAAPHAVRVVELDECATDMVTALAESYAYLRVLEAGR
jgi:sugar phosphate isomerase/epimerase